MRTDTENERKKTKSDDEAAKTIGTAVRLATHAFDGLDISDDDLDDLCDATLSEETRRAEKDTKNRG